MLKKQFVITKAMVHEQNVRAVMSTPVVKRRGTMNDQLVVDVITGFLVVSVILNYYTSLKGHPCGCGGMDQILIHICASAYIHIRTRAHHTEDEFQF